MAETIIWTAPERLLFTIFLYLLFIGGYKYYSNARKKESERERNLLYGFALLILLSAVANIFYFLGVFYFQGTFENGIYIGTINDNLSPAHEIFAIGNSFFHGGMILFIFQFERAMRKTKYIMTCLAVVLYIIDIIIIWNTPLNRDLWYMIFILIELLVFLQLFWLLKLTDIEFQNLGVFIIIGLMISAFAPILEQPEIKEMGIIPIELTRVIWIIGILLMIIPAFINIERIIKTNPNIILFTFLLVMIFLLVFYTVIFNLILIMAIFGYVLIILILVIVLYVHLKNVKNFKNQGVPLETLEGKDILMAFSRPKNLTEDEISISKEKQICLVCKNKLGGNIFLCSSCGAFYCAKCSDTLSGMENACWVCNAAFDETKPVKKEEKIEEELEIGKKN